MEWRREEEGRGGGKGVGWGIEFGEGLRWGRASR